MWPSNIRPSFDHPEKSPKENEGKNADENDKIRKMMTSDEDDDDEDDHDDDDDDDDDDADDDKEEE